MGAPIMTEKVALSMERSGSFYSTYGWHPYSVHAALVILRHEVGHNKGMLEHVAKTSGMFRAQLGRIGF